jgi:hypothetical protein
MYAFFKGLFQSLINLFKSMYQGIVTWIGNFFSWLWRMICYVGQIIWDFFFHADSGLVWWFIEQLMDIADWFLNQFPDFSALIDQYSNSITTTKDLLGKINAFMPIVETGYMIGIFLIFVGIYLGAKFIIKCFIPGVG